MTEYDWPRAVAALEALRTGRPGDGVLTYGGRLRSFYTFGITTEIATIRGLAEALFGWLE